MGTLNDTLRGWRNPAAVGVAAAVAAVAAAPVPENLKGQAAEHFLETFMLSKVAGNEWVTTRDVAKIVELFRTDESIANFYLIFSKSSNESALHSWICDEILPRVTS